jgi:acyl carrier protein
MITPDPQVEIGRFLAKYNGGVVPNPDADVFDIGALTSLVATQLVLLIEKRWGFEVPIPELKRDNFRTLRAICNLVERNAPAATSLSM